MKVILFYIMISTKKINKRRCNVRVIFVDYSYLTFSLWVLVNSIGKVSNDCIRDLRFNHRLHQKLIGLHQKLIGVLVW